jgi:integration host factor subunit alpha
MNRQNSEQHYINAVNQARREMVEDGLSASTLTKAELSDILFDSLGLNKREAKDFVDAFFDEIRLALESGNSVKLSGFGNFQLRDKPQRPGRNPKTGQEIPIAARRVVTFHPSQKIKQMVDQVVLPEITQG